MIREMIARVFASCFLVAALSFAGTAHAALFSATLPASRSVQVGDVATFFGTIINAGSVTADGCRIELLSPIDASFSYQAANASNQVVGDPDAPVSIPAGGAQAFLLKLTPNTIIDPLEVEFTFTCDNDGPAPNFPGLNTLLFSASDLPTPDMVAQAETVSGDGISIIPPREQLGFFSVASVNVGSPGTLEVTARGTGTQPTALFICQTDPLTGVCLEPPALSATTTVGALDTPTYAVFLGDANAKIPFDPAGNRVIVEFRENGVIKGATSVAARSTTATDAYPDVGTGIVQTRCVACHVAGGISGNTRLVFQRNPSADPGIQAANAAVFETYIDTVSNGANQILNKVQGALAHGGGVQLTAGSEDFEALSVFLELLGGSVSANLSPATLFDTVTMAGPQQTLRKAAIIFAGRGPTDEELASVAGGDEQALRQAIRGLMQGPSFHEFLIESANDRLLTDRQLDQGAIDTFGNRFLVLLFNRSYDLHYEVYRNGADEELLREWQRHVNFGAARAPLELIAYVVENDLPYTEVLTADYTLANPYLAQGFGSTVPFEDPSDQHDFKPVRIESYYRDDESKVSTEWDNEIGAKVLDFGNLATEYPHAGILNTYAFLTRYPSTSTNRNRARARWTYYHFLGFDIEKSASRTADPDALADTNNPTMNNPACTVCHEVMDPVAGAFQNYGDEGNYRDKWEGLDSLDDHYKCPPNPDWYEGSNEPYCFEDQSPYVYGDTWFRDVRSPGFNGDLAPNADNSLQWLAQRITADPRFAEATVKFWWPAVMGTTVLEAPEEETDAGFAGRLLGANAQALLIADLGSEFRSGIRGGAPFDLKDLLVELVLTPWFRASSVGDADPIRDVALKDAGSERLLTPEQLSRKTLALTGYQWGRYLNRWEDRLLSNLTEQYRLYYGGIDSNGVTERSVDMTAVMAGVAQTHALEVSCPIVQRDFYMLPDGERHLFDGSDLQQSPVTEVADEFEVTGTSRGTRQAFTLSATVAAGDATLRVDFLNDFYDEQIGDRNLMVDGVGIRSAAGANVPIPSLATVAASNCGQPQGTDYLLWSSGCGIELPVSFPESGSYEIEIYAWGEQAGPETTRMSVALNALSATAGNAYGARQIKGKLVELYRDLLGIDADASHPDVEAAYQLFVQVWQRKKAADPNGWNTWYNGGYNCDVNDLYYYEGVLDDYLAVNEWGDLWYDWDTLDAYWQAIDMSDPDYLAQTWTVVLAYILMDYRYLHL